MGIFFRFILPSLFRRCLDHQAGPHSPRLHFCREPNLYRAGENHSYCRRVGITLLVSKPLPLSCGNLRWISRSSRGPSLPSPLFTHTEQPWGWYIVVKGNINIPWCQRVESNHWPSAYEADVLTYWTTRAYVNASCVDRSPFGIALTLVQVPGV